MSLDPESEFFLPQELIFSILQELSPLQWKNILLLSKKHYNTIKAYIFDIHRGILLTRSQSQMLKEIKENVTKHQLLHFNAPTSAGKTLISLIAALGKDGYVANNEKLFIVGPTSIMGLWINEIKKLFPLLKILKLCSGGMTISKGIDMLKDESKKVYNIVITSPKGLWECLRVPLVCNIIKYIILDEAHRDGCTEYIIRDILNKNFPHINNALLLSANSLKKTYKDIGDIFSITTNQELNIIPTAINYYHAQSLPSISNSNLYIELNDIMRLNALVAHTVIKSSVNDNDKQNHIIIYAPYHVNMSMAKCKSMPLILGYKVFAIRGGVNNIQAIQDFNNYPDKCVLLLSYKAGATGFSLDSDEVFLFDALQLTLAYTYQASRRALRTTSRRDKVYIHYMELNEYFARLAHIISEYDAKGIKFSKNYGKTLAIDYNKANTVFESLGLDMLTCSGADYVWVAGKQSKYSRVPKNIRNEVSKNILSQDISEKWSILINKT